MQITTGRRLHFGLYTPIPVRSLDLVFGGLGMMVDAQGTTLTATFADDWSVEGAHRDRVQSLLNKLVGLVPNLWRLRIHVESHAPAHQGWGTGTQLALALITVLLDMSGVQASRERVEHLASHLGRGQRSSIGITGFSQGGFLIDPGKSLTASHTAPVRTIPFPAAWTLVLVEPQAEQGLHAEAERRAFTNITSVKADVVTELRHIAEQIIVAAIEHEDFETFACNLTRFNYLSGSHYREVQHGHYATAETEARLRTMQEAGAKCYGQSSWGPGLFAFFPDEVTAQVFMQNTSLPGCHMQLCHAGSGHTGCFMLPG